jgi:hypothetical protein
MKKFIILFIFIGIVNVISQTVKSEIRPFGLEIINEAKIGGSDQESESFQTEILPSMLEYVNTTLNNGIDIIDNSAVRIDPSKIYFATESDVRVYFIGENMSNKNTLGFSVNDGEIESKDSYLIFPDASSNESVRNINKPLLTGDFVDLGMFHENTTLDFFLISNVLSKKSNIYSTDSYENDDGLNHYIVYALPNSPYIFIGFEQVIKNHDFTDLVFGVKIGYTNVNKLISTPEPSLLITLGSFFIIFMCFIYLRNK